MHIPSISDTKELELFSFKNALHESLIPCEKYDVNKWLYVPNRYLEYRYILGTRGINPLICIGINPSTAEPDNLDNTLKSVERIALSNGFDSFIMFNIYPQRATNPNDMEMSFNRPLHNENMAAFEYVLNLYSDKYSPSVWAAWGTIIEKRPYLAECLHDMVALGEKHDATWYSAGKRSKAGHPHHPLYLQKNAVLENFDMKNYMQYFN